MCKVVSFILTIIIYVLCLYSPSPHNSIIFYDIYPHFLTFLTCLNTLTVRNVMHPSIVRISRSLTCCAKASILLCLLYATERAIVCAERFIHSVDIGGGVEVASIRHTGDTLLAITHLSKFGKLSTFCTVQEMQHGGG